MEHRRVFQICDVSGMIRLLECDKRCAIRVWMCDKGHVTFVSNIQRGFYSKYMTNCDIVRYYG